MTTAAVRRCGLAAAVLAILSLILAPLNALARMAPNRAAATSTIHSRTGGPSPRCGRFHPLVELGLARHRLPDLREVLRMCSPGRPGLRPRVRSLRPRARFAERWGWRLTLTSYCLMAVSLLFTYWIANLDLVFLVVTIPSLLLSTIGETMLGIGLLRAGFRPRLTGWFLALSFPLSQALVIMSTQALGMWPTMLAWGTAGWTLWRSVPTDTPPRSAPRSIAV